MHSAQAVVGMPRKVFQKSFVLFDGLGIGAGFQRGVGLCKDIVARFASQQPPDRDADQQQQRSVHRRQSEMSGESQVFFLLLGFDFFFSSLSLSRFLPPRLRLVVRCAGGAVGVVNSSSVRGRCSTTFVGSRISSASGFGQN